MSFNDAEVSQAAEERRNGGLYKDAAGEFHSPEAETAYNRVYAEPPLTARDLTDDLTEALTALEVPMPPGITTYRNLAGEIITEMLEQRDANAGKAWTQETLK